MYNFKEIEKKQQLRWQEDKIFVTDVKSNKKRYYILEMLPYPSGSLHMGHVRNYSIGDAVARYKWMKGYEVFHPIGWDSFGLPAENAAIKRGASPKDWTERNILEMRRQLQSLGFSYDWSREITTSNSKYYKWNQWLFSEMFDRGLAYKEVAFVNWSNKLQTVLANEQVEASFCSGQDDEIVKKELNQWFFKIRDYAEDLLGGLEEIDWPEKVKSMQRNWIGKSEGVEVEFEVPGFSSIVVFTTRLDTIYGATFLALSIGHDFVKKLAEKNEEIKEYIENAPVTKSEEAEIRGLFTDHYAVNPINGKRIPIWIADYVVDYGTKAVMSVPAHDDRDYKFAEKYSLKIEKVVECEEMPFTGYGKITNSGEFNDLKSQDAIDKMLGHLSNLGLAEKKVNYRLKDWLISRQRYWGTPIPIHYVNNEAKIDNNFPVKLPEDIKFSKGNPISTSPTFKAELERDLDTMDTFMDSSWYYMRYLDNNNNEEIFSKEIAKLWPQVDLYIGGVEHAVMHLLYSRFVHRVMFDLGLVVSKEPFRRLLTQGMVLAKSYYSKLDNKYYFPNEVKGNIDEYIVTLEKMSKSKNNGVSPEEVSIDYGVDAIRIFILFAAPPMKDLEWSDSGLKGAKRFLNRVWQLHENISLDLKSKEEIGDKEKSFLYKLNLAANRITNALDDSLNLNVAISSLMELLNDLQDNIEINRRVWSEGFVKFIKMLSPFAPHISEEIYGSFNLEKYVVKSNWPEVEEIYLNRKDVKIAIQINGKLRGTVLVDDIENRDLVVDLAKKEVEKRFVSPVKKVIYVKGRIVNFVL